MRLENVIDGLGMRFGYLNKSVKMVRQIPGLFGKWDIPCALKKSERTVLSARSSSCCGGGPSRLII